MKFTEDETIVVIVPDYDINDIIAWGNGDYFPEDEVD